MAIDVRPSCHICKLREKGPEDPICMACLEQGQSLFQADPDLVAELEATEKQDANL
jgi:hypothetical protein